MAKPFIPLRAGQSDWRKWKQFSWQSKLENCDKSQYFQDIVSGHNFVPTRSRDRFPFPIPIRDCQTNWTEAYHKEIATRMFLEGNVHVRNLIETNFILLQTRNYCGDDRKTQFFNICRANPDSHERNLDSYKECIFVQGHIWMVRYIWFWFIHLLYCYICYLLFVRCIWCSGGMPWITEYTRQVRPGFIHPPCFLCSSEQRDGKGRMSIHQFMKDSRQK